MFWAVNGAQAGLFVRWVASFITPYSLTRGQSVGNPCHPAFLPSKRQRLNERFAWSRWSLFSHSPRSV